MVSVNIDIGNPFALWSASSIQVTPDQISPPCAAVGWLSATLTEIAAATLLKCFVTKRNAIAKASNGNRNNVAVVRLANHVGELINFNLRVERMSKFASLSQVVENPDRDVVVGSGDCH